MAFQVDVVAQEGEDSGAFDSEDVTEDSSGDREPSAWLTPVSGCGATNEEPSEGAS